MSSLIEDNFKINENRRSSGIFCSHFIALLKKRMIYSKRDVKTIICEIFCPIVIVFLGLLLLTTSGIIVEQVAWRSDLSQYVTTQDIIYNQNLNDGSTSSEIDEIMGNLVES